MATSHDWESYLYAIDYTRTSNEAGVPLVDILRFLNWNGYPTVTLATVEGWVHAHQPTENSPPISTRRSVHGILPQTDHPEPTSSSSRGGTTAGVPSAETTSSNYSSNQPAPANNQTTSHQPTSSSSRGATTGANSTMPQNLPPASWDTRADRFVMSAHRVGTDIATITTQLNNNGYDHASMDDVISSLTRQGVTTLHFSPR